MMQKIQRHKSGLSLLLLIAFLGQLSSCTFYKMRTQSLEETTATEVVQENSNTNYFVLHVGDNMWALNDVIIRQGLISGNLGTVDMKVQHYYEKIKNGNGTRVPRVDKEYVYQVHIYANQFKKGETGIEIVNEDITGIDVYSVDGAKTTFTHVGTILLATAGGLAIFLAIACSCPHVYSFDGETYYFNNTLFTGAVNSKLERNDFKLMPDYFPESDTYQFIVQNEEEEKQYTNLLELIVVEHDANIQIIPDQDGKLYSISNPVSAEKITGDGQENLMDQIGFNDDKAYVFNNPESVDFSNAYATFRRPENASQAKLIVRAKTSEWAGFVYKEFSELFGKKYDNWTSKNQKNSKEEIEAQMKSMGIPLLISVKSAGEWIDLETIDLIGEVNYNSLIVPVNEKYFENDQVEIRVRSAFMFWKLDYLGMDFSASQNFETHYLKPAIAKGSGEVDYRNALASDDDMYMEHLQTGDSTYIEFKGLPYHAEKSRTIILRSKGYYTLETQYVGKPDRSELAKFRNEGEMSRFSKSLYNQYFDGITVKFE